MSAARDIETLYAEDGVAFTLRFVAEGRTLDVTFGEAVVGRLFSRWFGAPALHGLRVLPLISETNAGAIEEARELLDGLEPAPGYVHVRFITAGGDVDIELSGRLAQDDFDSHPARSPQPRRGSLRFEDPEIDAAAVNQPHGEHAVVVGHGHPDLSCVLQPGDDAESAGRGTAPPVKPEDVQ